MISDAGARVLVVEDDPTVAEVVGRYLQAEGFEVSSTGDGAEGLSMALADPPDLVILDLMLPLPVIMLTARSGEEERIAGLELGADDYVAKPFSPRELTARVKAVLRRAVSPLPVRDAGVLSCGDLVVDVAAREAHRSGQLLPLTVKEFDLMVHLMRHPRRAFRRDELLADVWGFEYGDTSTVTVHVRRLREKLEDDPAKPCYVTTVWGVGYRFDG